VKTSSAKAKGRRLCSLVRAKFLEWAPDLAGENIVVTPSGVTGPDLYLSPEAKKIYNYAVEAKCQEALNIWSAIEQAKTHVKGDEIPIVVFARNRTEPQVCLSLDDFLKLTR
jgi:hypothetical protein